MNASWQEEYLRGKKDIVFVGLNPTKEARKSKAVFSTRSTFWQILSDSKIIQPISLIIFCPTSKLGFVDLVEDCYEKDSRKVKVQERHVRDLMKKLERKGVKKIVLLGKKVTNSFLKEVEIKSKQKKSKSSTYGYIGNIAIDRKDVKVYLHAIPGKRSFKW